MDSGKKKFDPRSIDEKAILDIVARKGTIRPDSPATSVSPKPEDTAEEIAGSSEAPVFTTGEIDAYRASFLNTVRTKSRKSLHIDADLHRRISSLVWAVGYHMIIQLAAMKNIPSSYYEAAEIDGASKWVQFKSITFPLIKPILKVDAVLIITGSLKYYDLIAVMTGGGPNHATELMSTYMFYQGFRTLKYGYSAGIGVILLILCMCSVLLSNLVFRSEPVEF